MEYERLVTAAVLLTLLAMPACTIRNAATTHAPEVTASSWRDLLSTEERALLAPEGRAAELAWLEADSRPRPRQRRAARAASPRRRRSNSPSLLLVPAAAAGGAGLRLRLRRAPEALVSPHFALLYRDGGAAGARIAPSVSPRRVRREQRFFYEGTAPGVRGSQWRAAVRMRAGFVHGVIATPDGRLLAVKPLPARFSAPVATKRPHLLVTVHTPPSPRPMPQPLPPNSTNDATRLVKRASGRLRRGIAVEAEAAEEEDDEADGATLPPAVVETAVFVDTDLHEVLAQHGASDPEAAIVRFVLALVNAVQLLYGDPSLGRRVLFALKRVEVLRGEAPGLRRHRDIDRFLSNFCAWQRGLNPGARSPLRWDHALMLTGLDLYVVGKAGKRSSQVVGLAPVAGMCTATSSCTVNEGRHFESVYVVAHEIGHNLGMRHDGPLAGNGCDPGSFIMSPTLGRGKTTWSSCSRRYLQQFLRTSQARCLLDGGVSAEGLDHDVGGKLPGERFGATQQCVLKYGAGSTLAPDQPLEDICRDLHCARGRRVWTSHPALEGTACGAEGRRCRRGRCEGRGAGGGAGGGGAHARPGQRVDGSWSPWTPFGDCASGCLTPSPAAALGPLAALPASTGVMVATRRCNNPRPENGGRSCPGPDRRFRACHAEQCANVQPTSVLDFAEQVCRRAREVDPHLTGAGLQRTSSDPAEACAVWCYKKSGGSVSRGWTFPDGTACQGLDPRPSRFARHSHALAPTFCIGGRCEEFLCDRDGSATFGLPPEECAGSGAIDGGATRGKGRRRDADAHVPEGCYSGCVAPGRGLRVVAAPPGSRTQHTLRLCEPDHLECGRMRTPFEYASTICTGLRERVQRLSGFGMQLSAAAYDPDRPCRVACQDSDLPRRFYLVNGDTGWFPPGTDCGRGERQAYCVSGMCLDFGLDGSLQADIEIAIPLLNRSRRAVWDNHNIIARHDEGLSTRKSDCKHDHSSNGDYQCSTFPVDIKNPVYSEFQVHRTENVWNKYLQRFGVR